MINTGSDRWNRRLESALLIGAIALLPAKRQLEKKIFPVGPLLAGGVLTVVGAELVVQQYEWRGKKKEARAADKFYAKVFDEPLAAAGMLSEAVSEAGGVTEVLAYGLKPVDDFLMDVVTAIIDYPLTIVSDGLFWVLEQAIEIPSSDFWVRFYGR